MKPVPSNATRVLMEKGTLTFLQKWDDDRSTVRFCKKLSVPFSEDPRQNGVIEIPARHDAHHRLALEPIAQFDGCRQRCRPRTLGEVVRGAEGEAHAFGQLFLRQRDHIVELL